MNHYRNAQKNATSTTNWRFRKWLMNALQRKPSDAKNLLHFLVSDGIYLQSVHRQNLTFCPALDDPEWYDWILALWNCRTVLRLMLCTWFWWHGRVLWWAPEYRRSRKQTCRGQFYCLPRIPEGDSPLKKLKQFTV